MRLVLSSPEAEDVCSVSKRPSRSCVNAPQSEAASPNVNSLHEPSSPVAVIRNSDSEAARNASVIMASATMACVEVQASFKSGSLGVYVVFSRLSIGRVYQRDVVSKFGPNPGPRRRDSEPRIDFYTATGHAVLVDHLVHLAP